MSLKAFHVFFIAISTLLAAGFGLWSVRQFLATGNGIDLFFAVVGVLGTVGLPIYGSWFLRKTKKMGYV